MIATIQAGKIIYPENEILALPQEKEEKEEQDGNK